MYTYEALVPASGVSATVSGDTYGPGTQAIVPVHADGTAKLIANLNKLAPGAVPADCWMEVWVLGLMGGGGTVPNNDYAGLVKRIEALEQTSTGVSGTIAIGATGYTFKVVSRSASVFKSTSWYHTIINNAGENAKLTPVLDSLPEITLPTSNYGFGGQITTATPGSVVENDLGEKYTLNFAIPPKQKNMSTVGHAIRIA